MILSPNQTNNVNSQNGCGCGTVSKCCSCTFKLICDKSPYCCICKNSGSNCDLTPVLAALSEGFAYLNTHLETNSAQSSDDFAYVNNHISELSNDFAYLNNHLDEVLNAQTESFSYVNTHITNSTNQLIDIINELSNNINAKLEIIQSQLNIITDKIPDIEDNGIVTNPLVQNQSVQNAVATLNEVQPADMLVQKKGLFGKTKWVAEK